MNYMLIGNDQQNIQKTNGKKVNFKTYDKIVDNEIVQAKKIYYSNVFHMYKLSMKKTWQIINETLSRKKVDNMLPDTFIKNGNELSDPKEIANAFNEYFSKIGSNLASNIKLHRRWPIL